MSAPAIRVIIPTFNRKSALLVCLEHLERETCRDFEVSIVDDGSTDGTEEMVEQYRPKANFPLHYHRQANSGPARARNWSISESETWLSLLIGDDIFVSPTFLERHLAFHREHPEENLVALGLTNWSHDGQKVTRFMRWLSEDGVQFHYGELLAGKEPGWQHFYTSNLSFKTQYLKDHPFHEGFKFAAYEDVELGHRLEKQHGLKLYFLPDAVAEHLHPMDYLGSCRRMQKVGQSAYTLKQLWPEYAEYPPLSPGNRRLLRVIGRPAILGGLSHVTDWLTRLWCPNPVMKRLLEIHGRVGFEYARQEAQKSGV